MPDLRDIEVSETWALMRLEHPEPGPAGEPEVALLEVMSRTTYLTASEARRLAHKLLDWTGGMSPGGNPPGSP